MREAVRQALAEGAARVHEAFHNNPSGAQPLDWHSGDNCEPWFRGPVEEAPPAVRIWFFPQDVPLERELVPTGKAREGAIVAICKGGDFLAVHDLALEHRQTRNVSGLDRFMIRLEFAEVSCQS